MPCFPEKGSMKILIIFTLFICTTQAFAQRANVTILDSEVESKELERNFNVRRGSTHKSSLPDRDFREEVLSGVETVQKWDELKKDIFFMDLKSKSLAELKKKYPELTLAEIKSLKDRR